MRLLVDTNIVIDCLRKRQPFDEPAKLLLALGKLGEFELWLSPTQLGDAYYLLSDGGKKTLADKVRNELKKLREVVRVCQFGEQEIDRALGLEWPDFEDALVYEAARSIRADALITRNQRDFSESAIPVFDCGEFFDWFAERHDVRYAEIAMDDEAQTTGTEDIV